MDRMAEHRDLICDEDWNRLYERFIRNGAPYGAGTAFYENEEYDLI